MIIVTGANGLLGRAVIEALLKRVPAGQIGVSVRDPERARELTEQGVRVRRGDFTEPASLRRAFECASKVLVVSTGGTDEAAVRLHRTAIEAAAAAGAKRILYTSNMGARPSSPFPAMSAHAATEAALGESGVPYTTLRNGFYASVASAQLGAALKTGELVAPEDGPFAWTAHADLAEAAALALTEDVLDGVTPALTGPEAIDLAGVAAIAAQLTGRAIRRVVVSDADYRAGLLARGVPERMAGLTLGMFAAGRLGQFSPADPTLARLLGRPTVPLADVLKSTITQGR